jgi:ATP-dependent DNA helicase RecG
LDLKYLKGVGEKRAKAFEKTGIKNIFDFTRISPRIYIQKYCIRDAQKTSDENVIIFGYVKNIKLPSRINHPVIICLEDYSGEIRIPIFGKSEFRVRQFRLGNEYLFWGKVSFDYLSGKLKLDYRDHLKTDETLDNDFLKHKYFPIYELSGELKKSWIRPLLLTKIVYSAYSHILTKQPESIVDLLPEDLISKKYFKSKKNALLELNFPENPENVEHARQRLAFEELFLLQLMMALRKNQIKNKNKGLRLNLDSKEITKKYKNILPFELTNSQKNVINEIYTDMKSENVMNRLLQGDVGSGKTIVSFYGIIAAILSGYQVALMCPTEILAEQHYHYFGNLLDKFQTISGEIFKHALLAGKQKAQIKNEIINNIKNGDIKLIIGTHTLIQENVEFKNLGFVIIDEQHKFGVMQRAKLINKGYNPDLLVMTATPIPRTLSLTYYGDLDISTINELPKNRKPVKTFYVSEKGRNKLYDYAIKITNNGKQVYIVYPLIEETEKIDLKSLKDNFEILKGKIFKDQKIEMIHGKLKSCEKEQIMERFKRNEISVLVSTTVIEVGIDVPNAKIIIVEDSHRYGLSQLHQLRGRVGRSAEQSYCFLLSSDKTEDSRKRINIICSTNDGFKIAEEDLKIRGPGEYFGVKQSGLLNFSYCNLPGDIELLNTAKEKASETILSDPQLRKPENAKLKNNFLSTDSEIFNISQIS